MATLTDPIVILTIVQTIVLSLTMVIFIFQFRSQDLALKEAAYQKALDDQSSAFTMLLEHPELGGMMSEMAKLLGEGRDDGDIPVTDATRAGFAYMLLNYSLFERVFLLYKRKWIDKDTWDQWYAWMKSMARHPTFQQVHRRSQGTFDRSFQDLVEQAIGAGQTKLE